MMLNSVRYIKMMTSLSLIMLFIIVEEKQSSEGCDANPRPIAEWIDYEAESMGNIRRGA